jgi:acetyl esterase/lipase
MLEISMAPARAIEAKVEETTRSMPGATTYVYREIQPEPLRLFVFRPEGMKVTDHRPAFVWFYGGGWNHGTPMHAAGWAKWAASLGLVGIAPDYRVLQRFGTPPSAAVADGRAALQWIELHATELGIDPHRIVVGGNSAGGHLALWTAISHVPPGSDPKETPPYKPVALVLTSTPTDLVGPRAQQHYFGPDSAAMSPLSQFDHQMPAILMFHGDADPLVPYGTAIAFRDALLKSGNSCQFVSVLNGGHNYTEEWNEKVRAVTRAFLAARQLLGEQGGR